MRVYNTNYRVSWSHTPPRYVKKLDMSTLNTISNGSSTCWIHKYVKGDRFDPIIAEATVNCHYQDQYSKEQGRRHSMRKALEVSGISTSEWTHFWKSYKNRNINKNNNKDK